MHAQAAVHGGRVATSAGPRGGKTLVDVLRNHAEHSDGRRAVTYLRDGEDDAVTLTYAELDRRARATAVLLRERGLKPGDRALLLHPQSLDYLVAFLGCLYAGVIAVPFYPPHPNRPERTLPKVCAVARDCDAAAALVTTAGFPPPQVLGGRTEDTAADSTSDGWVAAAPILGQLRWVATDDIPDELADAWSVPPIDEGTPTHLQYTSGSTAEPKGVIVSHRNVLHNELMIAVAMETDATSVFVGWLPLFHDMGLIGAALQPLFIGVETVLLPPVAVLQRPLRWLRAISRYRATVSGGPNFGYDLCIRKIGPEQRAELDLRSWRVAYTGAEPIRWRTLRDFSEAFGPSGFRKTSWYPCFGLAEVTLFGSGQPCVDSPTVLTVDPEALERGRAVAARPGARGRDLVGCGRAWLDRRIAIVDPQTCRPVPAGRVGEIWLAGADVATGYWGQLEESDRTFGVRLSSGEGPFLRTGDLGFIHEGELFVTGRIKDLIIVAGRNHYPQDIELTVEECHPAIRRHGSAAFSVEVDGRESLVVVAELEREYRTEDPARLEAVTRAVRRAIAEEHDLTVEDLVLIRPASIPKTSSGKVQRAACRASLLAGRFAGLILSRSTLTGRSTDPGRSGNGKER